MAKLRTDRLNSLLKEVISDIIRKEVRNPKISEFITITSVSITRDLRHAKVYVSVIGNDEEKTITLKELNKAAGFIGSQASQQIVIRFFPSLTFILDNSVEKQIRIDTLLGKIHDEQERRNSTTE